MNPLLSIIRGRLAPLFAGVIALYSLLVVGFRGFSASTLDWLERAEELADDIRESPQVVSDWSAETEGLVDIFAALIHLATPGFSEWVLFGFSILAGATATAMVFFISQRLAGAIGGWMSLFFLLTCSPWIGPFTRVDPTFFVVPVLLGILIVWHARSLRWWWRSLVCAPLLVVGVLLWSGTAVVLALLLVVELLAPTHYQPAEQHGLLDGPSIRIDRIVTPVAALVLLALYPLFWPSPVEQIGEFFLAGLELPPAEFVFRGDAYPPARPPLYAGAAWLLEQVPLATVMAIGMGIIWTLRKTRTEDRRLVLGCAALALALLSFPVFFRNPRPLGAEFGVLFLAVAIPLASLVTCRFFAHALGRNAPSKKVRQVAIVAFLLAGISVLIETPRATESPETFRSPMTARLVGWSATGDMPMREDILPVRLIEVSGADRNNSLFSGGLEPYLERYRRMHLITDIRTTPDPTSADIAIRNVPPISADRFSIHPSSYMPPLPDSQTTVVPAIHRPRFLIDRAVSTDPGAPQ